MKTTDVKKIRGSKDLIYFFLCLVVAATPLLWFKGTILAGEEFYGVDYGHWGSKLTSTWFEEINYGSPNQLMQFRLQGHFFQLLYTLGVSQYVALVTWTVFLWLVGATGMYLLLSAVFNKKLTPEVKFIATVFYIYNPFFLNISPLLSPPRIVLSALPFILYLLVKHLTSSSFKHLFLLLLVLFLSTPAFVNLPGGFVLFIPILVYIPLRLIFAKKSQFIRLSLHFLLFFIIYLVTNLWWVLPFRDVLTNTVSSVRTYSEGFTATKRTDLYEVISGFGSWAFREKVGDHYYFNYNEMYYQIPVVFFRYVPTMLVFLAVYFFIVGAKKSSKQVFANQTKENIEFILFTLLFLSMLFLSKGENGAMGEVYGYLFKHLPGFWVFREPYLKFVPVLIVSSIPLVAYSLSELITRISSEYKYLTLVFVFISAVLIGYPYWTGRVLWSENDGLLRSYTIVPPEDWLNFVAENSKNDGNYMVYPSLGYLERYSWPSGYAGNKFMLFTDIKTVFPTSSYTLNLGVTETDTYLYDRLMAGDLTKDDTPALYNISGLFFQKDVQSDEVILENSIREKYKDNLVLSNSNLDMYQFSGNPSDIRVVPKSTVILANTSESGTVANLKAALPLNTLIGISPNSGEHKIYGLEEKSDKVYKLTGIPDGTYSLVNSEIQGEILLDGNKIDIGAPIAIGNGCCEELKVVYEGEIPVNIVLEGEYLAALKSDGGLNFDPSVSREEAAILRKYFRFYGFSEQSSYKINISNNSGAQIFTTFRVIEKEPTTGTMREIAGGSFILNRGNNLLEANPTNNFKLSADPEYYVALDFPHSNFDSASRVTMEVHRVLKPKMYLVQNAVFDETVHSVTSISIPEYTKLNPALYVVKPPATDGYIQLMQSFNPGWRAISISDGSYEKLSQGDKLSIISLYLKYLFIPNRQDFSSPLNVEHVSNAWDISKMPGKTVVLVYGWEGVNGVTYWGSVLFFMVGVALVIKKV